MDTEIQKPKIEHIQRWQNAIERVKQAERELNHAEVELKNSETNLGKVLCPADSKKGETFQVWTENCIISVEVLDKGGNGTYKISYRK